MTNLIRNISGKLIGGQNILDSKERLLRVNKLDKKSLNIIAVSDASFAYSPDVTTQLGHIIVLTDNTGRVNNL